MRLPFLVIALMLGSAGMALAQIPEADGPVATASGTSFPSTQQQIDAYLADPPVLERPARWLGDGDAMVEDDGRIHGEVSLSVGTGGYRSGSVAAVIPLPRDGTLALEYRQTKSDRGYGYGAGYGIDGLDQNLSPFGVDCSPARTGAASLEPRWVGRPRETSTSCPMR